MLRPNELRALADLLERLEASVASASASVPVVAPPVAEAPAPTKPRRPRRKAFVIIKSHPIEPLASSAEPEPKPPKRRRKLAHELTPTELEAQRRKWRAARTKHLAKRAAAAPRASKAPLDDPGQPATEDALPGPSQSVARASGFAPPELIEAARKWTPAQLATASGVSQVTIRDALAGRLTPQVALDALADGVQKLASACEVAS
ncbi:MAG: hypothetical protein KA712_16845 [Myxococcales bacterium]|nr:hypothetical protein [Myxococcales bacterium]